MEEYLKKLETELKIRAFIEKKVDSYISHNQRYLEFIKNDANSVTEDELIRHCSRHLQHLKCPKRIISLKSIPQTSSGKLLKKKLRSLYEDKYYV